MLQSLVVTILPIICSSYNINKKIDFAFDMYDTDITFKLHLCLLKRDMGHSILSVEKSTLRFKRLLIIT